MISRVPVLLYLLAVSGLLVVWSAPQTSAQNCISEVEPNNEPSTAKPFESCAEGALQADDQDLFIYTVSPDDAGQLFVFSIEVLPASLTNVVVLRLERDNEAPRRLFDFTSFDGSLTSTDPILLAPGNYLIAIATASAGRYTLSVTETSSRLSDITEVEPNDQRDASTPVEEVFALSGEGTGDEDWFVWTVDDITAQERWHLTAQTWPGEAFNLRLFDSNNSLLTQSNATQLGRADLYDLKLAAGQYYVRLSSSSDLVVPYRLSADLTEVLTRNYENEPNDNTPQVTEWQPGDVLNGRLAAPADKDRFGFQIDEAHRDQVLEVILESDSLQTRRLCISAANSSTTLQCRSGIGYVELVDLNLLVGNYIAQVDGETDLTENYTLLSRFTRRVEPDTEAEPNDSYQQANMLQQERGIRGRFYGDERDVYHLLATGEPQLWRIQAIGEGLTRLTYINTAGQREQAVQADDQDRLRLLNLYLLPGSHYFEVSGTFEEYRLVAVPLGPPPAGLELEPNDKLGQANRLRFAEPRIGLLNEEDDQDTYRFSLTSEEHIRLTVTPPEDGLIDTAINWGTLMIGGNNQPVVGQTYIFESTLLPGEYEVRLISPNSADSPYTLLLERGDPFVSITDREPNNELAFASPVPASLVLRGTVGTRSDDDWYELPTISEDVTLEIDQTAQYDLRLLDADANPVQEFALDRERERYTGLLDASAPQPFYLRVAGRGDYEFELSFSNGLMPVIPVELALDLEFTLNSDTVAAHWYTGQVVDAQLQVTNRGTLPHDVMLDAHTSHFKVDVDLAETEIRIAPEEQVELSLRIVVADDLPIGEYPITLRMHTTDGNQVTTAANLKANPVASPVEVHRIWPIPAPMLGGMNAAALSFGAEIITEDSALANAQQALHDGYTSPISGFSANASELPFSLTVRLTGDEPIPVSGILLNPQSEGEGSHKLRNFELWLSLDGQSYTQVLSDRLSPLPNEQAFLLSEPVMAHYAQLRLLDNHHGNSGTIELGEWKVVTTPDGFFDQRLNIADPQYGGHVVYTIPQVNQAALLRSILVTDETAYEIELSTQTEAEWVLGFHHQRAAQVTDIEWVPATEQTESFSELSVWGSLESPVGPWTLLGQLPLTSEVSTLSLPQPTWVRYIRLLAPGASQEIQFHAPDAVRVWEQPSNGNYRSIVREWGHYNRNGVYEWLHPLEHAPTAAAETPDDNREQATLIQSGQNIQGDVQIGEDVDWYRIDIPTDRNAISVHIFGDPTIRIATHFEDIRGNPLPTVMETLSPGEQVVTVIATPDETVYFKVEEPPRSIIFAWDNSPSVSAYYDSIYNLLALFVEGVKPGREVANFVPFGSGVLLQTWGEQPATLQQALNDYDRSDTSSDAVGSLLLATNELASREGTTAVMIITDATWANQTPNTDLWRTLATLRPRVFSLHVITQLHTAELPADEQDIMQSWASVNGGYYDYLRSESDLETAFERVTTWLRRPADYSFVADVIFAEPPGPGTLQVVSGIEGGNEDGVVALDRELLGDTSIEIILDASWSMNELLEGRKRIDIAREALLNLINDVLPEGTPIALRAFGNREGNFSCRTDLELPLQPMNRSTISTALTNIVPQPNANTAIAAALLEVPDDLAEVSGERVIILLTDGEETCQGDPEAAITALREQGLSVRINIVGFAIADDALRADFERWTALGGGQYFDANNADELSASLAASLRTPYQVLDAEGQIIAEGFVDGDPITLPAGVYSLKLMDQSLAEIDNVTIRGEEETVLSLQSTQE